MTATASIALPARPDTAGRTVTWLVVAAGLLLLYVPTYHDIAVTYWGADDDAHGVVVIAMWLWLVWRERELLAIEQPTLASASAGWAAVAIGAACYALGRSQELYLLEAGSQLAVLPGIALVLLGPAATRRLWFVWLFLLFTVPVPGSIVDALLVPMKEMVAAAVTESLHVAGLPIARDGVVIYIGQYQLFIADACSGLNQLVSLAAVGLLYARVTGPRSRRGNAILVGAIVPIAVSANLLRVMSLVLATYYGGDASGRALHDVVSFVEIAIAFGSFFMLDRLMRLLGASKSARP